MRNHNFLTISGTLVAGIVCALLLGAANEQPKQISCDELVWGKTLIIGKLGKPYGTFMNVEGTMMRSKSKGNWQLLSVDTMDGRKLDNPIVLELSESSPANINNIAEGSRCVFRGYESGGMDNLPIDPERNGAVIPQQRNYGFSTWFVGTQLKSATSRPNIEPKD